MHEISSIPMSRRFCSLLLIVSFSLFSQGVARSATEGDALPTQDEIHQLFDKGQYTTVLQKIAKVLALEGKAAKPYDRHDLIRLKAEAHLRLKAYGAAEKAFSDAGWQTEDRTAAAIDFSTAVLIHRSRVGQYQPVAKVNGKLPDPLSVIEPAARKLALQALFADELAADKPKILAVRDAKALDPLCRVASLVTDLKVLELGATGGSDLQTKEIIAEVAKHAQDVMGDAVREMMQRETLIVNRASEQVEYYVNNGTAGHPFNQLQITSRGFDVNDKKELYAIKTACGKIAPAARAFGDAMAPDGDDLITTGRAAARLETQAGSERVR